MVVNVLMSTYNGAKYLHRQIDSILTQKDVSVCLFIRDDGSTDNTVSILDEYSLKNLNIHVTKGSNIGYAMSFLWLVYNCPTPANNAYYAFSDQDDIWEENKLLSAINLIQSKCSSNIPVVYYSDLKVVDANERYIRHANDWESNIDRHMLLTFIGIRGCTMVYNHQLQDILISKPISKVASHDTFVALVGFWAGKVVYDPDAHILYRQTGDNVSITGVNPIDKLKKNLLYVRKRMSVKSNERRIMAENLLKYREYIPDCRKIERLAFYNKSLTATMKLLFDKSYYRHRSTINIVNFVLILFRKI